MQGTTYLCRGQGDRAVAALHSMLCGSTGAASHKGVSEIACYSHTTLQQCCSPSHKCVIHPHGGHVTLPKNTRQGKTFQQSCRKQQAAVAGPLLCSSSVWLLCGGACGSGLACLCVLTSAAVTSALSAAACCHCRCMQGPASALPLPPSAGLHNHTAASLLAGVSLQLVGLRVTTQDRI